MVTSKTVLMIGAPHFYACVQESLPGYSVVQCNSDSDIDKNMPVANVILDASMLFHFGSERLSQASDLELYVAVSTGTAHVDREYLSSRNVPILSLLGRTEISDITVTAEHSWLLLLSVARRLYPAILHVREGGWNRNLFDSPMLRGKNMGIVGCGRIGTWMSRYANAFGMNVMGSDPNLPDWEYPMTEDINELFRVSDFISIHADINDSSRGMVCSNSLGMMRSGVIIVNTSSSEIVNEWDLVDALESGKVAGVGLDDVQDGQDSILVKYAVDHNNVIITPHMGGYSSDALVAVLSFSCKRVTEFYD